MLDIPASNEDLFTGWAVRILQEGFNDLEGVLDASLELIDTAVEEFLRVCGLVTIAREVVVDTNVAGCPIRRPGPTVR